MNVLKNFDPRKIDMGGINWQRLSGTYLPVLTDTKLLLCVATFFCTLYFIGYEEVYKTSMDALKSRDDALKNQQSFSQQHQQETQQYQTWQQELKGLNANLIKIGEGEVSTVVAATQYSKIKDLATGKRQTDPNATALPTPHNVLQHVDIKPAVKSDVTLAGSAMPGASADAGKAGLTGGHDRGNAQAVTQDIPLQRYDYEITATGTYPALANFINEMVLQPDLIVIRSIKMVPTAQQSSADAAFRPDPKSTPDFPVKIDMTVNVSVYLYSPVGATP